MSDDPLEALRQHIEQLVEAENTQARLVELQRRNDEYYRWTAEYMIGTVGWSSALYDLIAAQAEAFAAAKASLDAAVSLRQATEKLLGELEG